MVHYISPLHFTGVGNSCEWYRKHGRWEFVIVINFSCFEVYFAYILYELFMFILILYLRISEAFCSMMTGGNVGKQVVKISDWLKQSASGGLVGVVRCSRYKSGLVTQKLVTQRLLTQRLLKSTLLLPFEKIFEVAPVGLSL